MLIYCAEVVKIKGLLILNKQNFKERIKSLLGIYETKIIEHNGRAVFVLKTQSYNNTVRKRFIRKNIRELAVIPDTKENKNILAGEGFNLISKNKLIKKNLSSIIAKYSNSSGIEKGKLVVGILADDPAEILNKLVKISDFICEVYLYGIKSTRSLKAADSFYKETGIGVIVSESARKYSCDILVSQENKDFCGYKGAVISLFDTEEKTNAKTIKGAKLKIKDTAKIEGADDLVIAELFELPVNITRLIIDK